MFIIMAFSQKSYQIIHKAEAKGQKQENIRQKIEGGSKRKKAI